MSRKISVVLVALMMAIAFAATMAVAGDPPTQITIDKVADKKPGVPFDHAEHADSIDCLKCHHKDASKESIDKDCFECHGKDPAANDPTSTKSTVNPFHILCKGCHKDEGKGPTKCSDCHVK